MRFKLIPTPDGGSVLRRVDPTARATMERLYGQSIDVDKVWEDRDALHAATHSMTATPRRLTWPVTN